MINEPLTFRTVIRWMIRRDVPEVLEIERAGHAHPLGKEDIYALLRRKFCIGMVAEWGARIAGFMIYELDRGRLDILDFAVDPDFRRSGVGTQMVEKLHGKLAEGYRDRLVIEVRETDMDRQLFFRRMGFKAIGVIRNHFDDSGEDAYVMQYTIP